MPSETSMSFQDNITENHSSSPPGPMPQLVLRLRGLPPIQPLRKPSKADNADTVEPDELVPSTSQEQLQDEDSDDTEEHVPTVKQRKIEKPKSRGTFVRQRFGIPRIKKEPQKQFKYSQCKNRYDTLKKLNTHYCSRHQKVKCLECGKICLHWP